jgi:hypothetical protein
MRNVSTDRAIVQWWLCDCQDPETDWFVDHWQYRDAPGVSADLSPISRPFQAASDEDGDPSSADLQAQPSYRRPRSA